MTTPNMGAIVGEQWNSKGAFYSESEGVSSTFLLAHSRNSPVPKVEDSSSTPFDPPVPTFNAWKPNNASSAGAGIAKPLSPLKASGGASPGTLTRKFSALGNEYIDLSQRAQTVAPTASPQRRTLAEALQRARDAQTKVLGSDRLYGPGLGKSTKPILPVSILTRLAKNSRRPSTSAVAGSNSERNNVTVVAPSEEPRKLSRTTSSYTLPVKNQLEDQKAHLARTKSTGALPVRTDVGKENEQKADASISASNSSAGGSSGKQSEHVKHRKRSMSTGRAKTAPTPNGTNSTGKVATAGKGHASTSRGRRGPIGSANDERKVPSWKGFAEWKDKLRNAPKGDEKKSPVGLQPSSPKRKASGRTEEVMALPITSSRRPSHSSQKSARRESGDAQTALLKTSRGAARPSSAVTAMAQQQRPHTMHGSRPGVPRLLDPSIPNKRQSLRDYIQSRQSTATESVYESAANAIVHADFLLVCAGAGFSADSGLPVYKDIADVQAYRRQNLTYADLCDPVWIHKDPSVFFGFWGHCYNSYLDTEPHQGYGIVKKWLDTLFDPDFEYDAETRRRCLKSNGRTVRVGTSRPGSSRRPSSAMSRPGSAASRKVLDEEKDDDKKKKSNVFIYTSNVDTAFKRAGFSDEIIDEIHGNVMTWQCAGPCRKSVWNLDEDWRFDVKNDMRAPRSIVQNVEAENVVSPRPPAEAPEPEEEEEPFSSKRAIENILKARAERAGLAQPSYMPQSPQVKAWNHIDKSPVPANSKQNKAAWCTVKPTHPAAGDPHGNNSRIVRIPNHQKCKFCPRTARPNVLMFEDAHWIETPQGRYNRWLKHVKKELAADARKRLVIVECGCGIRVPTVRENSEKVLKDCLKLSPKSAQLIRVNPDYPRNPRNKENTISIKDTCLDTLKRIDAAIYERLQAMGMAAAFPAPETPPDAPADNEDGGDDADDSMSVTTGKTMTTTRTSDSGSEVDSTS